MNEHRTSTICKPLIAAALLLGAACGEPLGADPEPADIAVRTEAISSTPDVDIGRSLAITDLPTLSAVDAQGEPRFSLRRVLAQLAATSGATPPPSPAALYQRIFDTNNTKASAFVPDGQHCDDEKDAHGNPTLNGSPLECPRQEGALADLAAHSPFCGSGPCDPYSPIAVTNRFDLAPANGQTCGQYRIVFGKGVNAEPVATAGNQDAFNRNLIIFEAVLPNPHPSQGLLGCKPVVEHWVGLGAVDDPAARAAALDRFFFTGIPGFAPALRFAHFSGAVDAQTGVQLGGQIRANQFMFALGGQPWQLREYNTARRCTGAGTNRKCTALVKLVTPKVNPDASLFDDANQSPRALAFRDPQNPKGFFGQLAALATPDLNLLNMNGLDPAFNGAQSTSSPSFPVPGAPVLNDTNYLSVFNARGAFGTQIQQALHRMGSPLGALHVVRRAQSQACAGCHELATSTADVFGGSPASVTSGHTEANQLGAGLVWPDTATGTIPIPAFTQTSDQILVPLADGVTCDVTCTAHPTTCACAWALSPALNEVFLPFRRDNIIAFLSKVYGGYTAQAGTNWAPAAARMRGSPDN